jgi:hypothetical protein
VCEGIQVTDITFSSDDDKRPVSAQWKFNSGGKGEVRFKWLVDASGRNGVLSTEYLKNRKFNQALKNIAYWGYFTGAVTYALGTRRENAPWVEALTSWSCVLTCSLQTRPGGRGSSRCTTAPSRLVSSLMSKLTVAKNPR